MVAWGSKEGRALEARQFLSTDPFMRYAAQTSVH